MIRPTPAPPVVSRDAVTCQTGNSKIKPFRSAAYVLEGSWLLGCLASAWLLASAREVRYSTVHGKRASTTSSIPQSQVMYVLCSLLHTTLHPSAISMRLAAFKSSTTSPSTLSSNTSAIIPPCTKAMSPNHLTCPNLVSVYSYCLQFSLLVSSPAGHLH